jgi:hypothetical protein
MAIPMLSALIAATSDDPCAVSDYSLPECPGYVDATLVIALGAIGVLVIAGLILWRRR